MERYLRQAQTLRRPSTMLDTVALIGLVVMLVFWFRVTWFFFEPPTVLSFEALFAVMLSGGLAYALPAMLAALLPSTPAGMLLQRTRARTWGFAALLGAAIFMLWFEWLVIDSWLYQFRNIQGTATHGPLVIVTLIIGVLLPTLAWVQVAPDRWLAEVMQAHEVKRLELLHDAQINAMKAQFARQALLLQKGLANLSAAEAAELVGTQEAIHRSINTALGDIARSMNVLTGVDTGVNILPDQQLTQLYDKLAADLERAQVRMKELPPAAVDAVALPAYEQPSAPTVRHQDAETVARAVAPPAPAVAPSVVRGGPQRTADAVAVSTAVDTDRGAYDAARRVLRGAWTRGNLQEALSIEKTKASDLIREWKAAGLVSDITKPAYHYAWTDERGA